MLVTQEDLGNVASASALVSNHLSTPSSAASVVGVSQSVFSTIQWKKREQYVVYVEWFGHWDQHCLHHQCEVAEYPVNTNHCIISSLSYKIKNHWRIYYKLKLKI